jgi:gas vesicle protein
MGFSTFGDSERSARASMILMNIAMVPSTIQMLAMTKSSIGLAAGMNGAAVGVNRLSFSLAGLKSALLKTGIGIAVVAIGSLAAWLFAGADEADNAADSMKEFGQAINYTAEQYKEMADAYQGVDSATMASDVATVTSEIAELQKLKAGTDDDSLLKSYTNRIEALKEERAILLDIQNINTATSLVGDTASATEVFDMVKDYQQAGRDAKAAAEANNFLDAPNNFLADRDVYSEMSFGLFDPESAKQKQARLEGVYADAFAAIPQEFQGAIMELAENADTAEDFIADLADFIASDINGIQLDQFGATVQEDIIGPIEAAKEAAFEFANSREEMFFGMAKGNITGDMVKQVVNKGVETLINTTEVIMTNNFNGMTTGQAANEITKQVVRELNARGLNITV